MLHVQAEHLQTICAPSSDFVVFQLLLYVCEFLLCQGGWHMHQWIPFLHFTQVYKTYMWSEALWTTHCWFQLTTKLFHWFRRPPGRRVQCPNCSPESLRLAADCQLHHRHLGRVPTRACVPKCATDWLPGGICRLRSEDEQHMPKKKQAWQQWEAWLFHGHLVSPSLLTGNPCSPFMKVSFGKS